MPSRGGSGRLDSRACFSARKSGTHGSGTPRPASKHLTQVCRCRFNEGQDARSRRVVQLRPGALIPSPPTQTPLHPRRSGEPACQRQRSGPRQGLHGADDGAVPCPAPTQATGFGMSDATARTSSLYRPPGMGPLFTHLEVHVARPDELREVTRLAAALRLNDFRWPRGKISWSDLSMDITEVQRIRT